MKYLDREDQLNTMVHPVHTLKISDFDDLAFGGEEEGGRSPYEPYKPAEPSGPYVPPPPRKKDGLQISNLRPQDFIPFTPATRDNDGFAIPYLRTPELRRLELEHFKRFIRNTSADADVKRNTPMMIAKGKKKKKKGLTIHEEAARRDAFRDMSKEPYDPDTGRLGGGFDLMEDLLDGV